MTEHRTGVNAGFWVKHSLRLVGLNAENSQAVASEIDAMPGVDDVWVNAQKQRLKVAYDASHHNIEEILGVLKPYGVALKNTWWHRTRLGWQRQIDQNIYDNAHHEAHCCSKPPRSG